LEQREETDCKTVIMGKSWQVIAVLLVAAAWMQGCSEQKPVEEANRNVQYVSGADEVTYLKIGKEITDTIGSSLKMNLTKAMQESGPVNAVQFCNANAMELTAIYSEKYSTDVKRVSDRNRNEANGVNSLELDVLADFRQMMAKGETVAPRVAIDAEGKKNYYAPIFTGGLCLSCHGDVKNMQPELVAAIDSLYPKDKAKGYAIDELRGIWSIKFKNS
jgi:hypothetical protein